MRVKARRRLAGAVALVLAAVIVLPMLLDSEPKPIPASVEVTIPDRNSRFNPSFTASNTSDSAVRGNVVPATSIDAQNPGSQGTSSEGTSSNSADGASSAASPAGQATQSAQSDTTSEQTPTSEQAAAQTSTTKPAPESKAPEPKPAPQPPAARTDDGSRALALLEGRSPTAGAAAPAASSGFVVQVASYSTQVDANTRRDKLRSEGVTNAFVESTTVSGKPTFRLRVGPFASRDAAQAAQTRLRSLGYPTGFIATQ